uniref:Putative secreted protein n=1 Tax=Anopheles triannulatus TaxID=58253 RepID=A0A2M4B6X2_9DIPT
MPLFFLSVIISTVHLTSCTILLCNHRLAALGVLLPIVSSIKTFQCCHFTLCVGSSATTKPNTNLNTAVVVSVVWWPRGKGQ